jgi:erythromycin esterase
MVRAVPLSSFLLVLAACAAKHAGTPIPDVPPPPPPQLAGTVTSSDGQRVVGAVVAANRPGDPAPAQLAVSGPDGSFRFDLPAGRYAFTVTSEHGTAVHLPASDIVPGAGIPLILRPAAEGFLVTGQVAARTMSPVGVTVLAMRESDADGDVYATRTDHHGRYRLRLPGEARAYVLTAEGGPFTALPAGVTDLRDQALDLDVYEPAPAPAEALEWVQKKAIPLAGVEPGTGFADLAALGALVGSASLVGLGEATHGSHEFFRLKHRLLEYLVVEKGFTGLAVEAPASEARRVNDYVLHGRGSAAAALAGLRYWSWDSEELLALVEWMRAYNRDARHKHKLQFFGIDMDVTPLAASGLEAYLAEVDPGFSSGLGLLARASAVDEWLALPRGEREALHQAAEATVLRLENERTRYEAKRGALRWKQARQDARLLSQWTVVHARDTAAGDFDFRLRAAAMAENMRLVVDELGPSGKLVLWAHNGHVGLELPPLVSLGQLLRERYGTGYLAFGLVFGQGGFRARAAPGAPGGEVLTDFQLGPAPDTDWTTPLARTGLPVALLDLRRLPEGPVRGWLGAPQPVRDVGVRFTDEARATSLQVVPRRYDAVIYVARTTPSRAN